MRRSDLPLMAVALGLGFYPCWPWGALLGPSLGPLLGPSLLSEARHARSEAARFVTANCTKHVLKSHT